MKSNEQKLVDICFEIAMIIKDPEFREELDCMSRDELGEWVANQLRKCGFNTEPCCASWGVLI